MPVVLLVRFADTVPDETESPAPTITVPKVLFVAAGGANEVTTPDPFL
jgi:hypothetical protein